MRWLLCIRSANSQSTSWMLLSSWCLSGTVLRSDCRLTKRIASALSEALIALLLLKCQRFCVCDLWPLLWRQVERCPHTSSNWASFCHGCASLQPDLLDSVRKELQKSSQARTVSTLQVVRPTVPPMGLRFPLLQAPNRRQRTHRRGCCGFCPGQ